VQISEVTNTDSPPATAENSLPVYQLDRSEEDWSGLCRQAKANERDDLWDPLKCIGSQLFAGWDVLVDLFGNSFPNHPLG
jgi:hypothetical protein